MIARGLETDKMKAAGTGVGSTRSGLSHHSDRTGRRPGDMMPWPVDARTPTPRARGWR